MENSGLFLFKDDSACWYVAQGESWIGPMSASDVYSMILNHQISWIHYVWRKGQLGWQRVCEIDPFEQYAPDQSKPKTKPNESQAVSSQEGPRKWFLHYKDSQFGPFSRSEILRFLDMEKITPRVHAWSPGMSNWQRIESISELQRPELESKEQSIAAHHAGKPGSNELASRSQNKEQRANPRRPLVAKIILSDDQSVILGVCRDISTGGMQVLTDDVPVKLGTLMKMNVSPSTNEIGPKIPPFVAEGQVVRILEDGRGFSFRFTQLSDTAKKSIELYIESND